MTISRRLETSLVRPRGSCHRRHSLFAAGSRAICWKQKHAGCWNRATVDRIGMAAARRGPMGEALWKKRMITTPTARAERVLVIVWHAGAATRQSARILDLNRLNWLIGASLIPLGDH